MAKENHNNLTDYYENPLERIHNFINELSRDFPEFTMLTIITPSGWQWPFRQGQRFIKDITLSSHVRVKYIHGLDDGSMVLIGGNIPQEEIKAVTSLARSRGYEIEKEHVGAK